MSPGDDAGDSIIDHCCKHNDNRGGGCVDCGVFNFDEWWVFGPGVVQLRLKGAAEECNIGDPVIQFGE
jgi:hypothetical protein